MGDAKRQEGEKPCSRTGTGMRQSPGEWVPASSCAEGERTPREALGLERAQASQPGQTLKGNQPSERRSVKVFDFHAPAMSQEDLKVAAARLTTQRERETNARATAHRENL